MKRLYLLAVYLTRNKDKKQQKMKNKKLLTSSKSSFWNTQKKLIITLSILAVITVTAGFYLYAKTEAQTKNGEVLSQIPPPTLVPDGWLKKYFDTYDVNDPKVGGNYGDPDNDKLNNYQEFIYGTDPTNPDTDGDWYYDGTEVAFKSNPLLKGVEDISNDLQKRLRSAGFDVDIEKVEQEFFKDLNIDRTPIFQYEHLSDWQINISSDNSAAAIDNYHTRFKETTAFLEKREMQIQTSNMFTLSSLVDIERFIGGQSQMINRLMSLAVPSDLKEIHKTYIKMYDGYLSMAKFARSQIESGTSLKVTSFYPELQYVVLLDSDLEQERKRILDNYQIEI
jgi:hypothetical protein